MKSHSRRDRKVVVYLRGGLGNQLFQYFAGRELAISLEYRLILDTSLLPNIPFTDKRGISVFADALGQLSHSGSMQRTKFYRFAPEGFVFFVLTRLAQLDRQIGGLFPELWARLGRLSSDNFLDLEAVNQKSRTIVLNSPFLEEQVNLDLVRRHIQELFTPKASSAWFLSAMREIHETKPVSVHVRLGDHLRLDPNLNFDFYLRAREWIDEFMPNSPVWIFSDEPNKARLLLGEAFSDCSFVEPEHNSHPIESFLLMASGRALICGKSTYSLWAAQLVKSMRGIVVGDREWVSQVDAPGYLGQFTNDWILI